MSDFLKNILLGKQYLGIEFFSLNGEERIAFLQAEKSKGKVAIINDVLVKSKVELSSEKSKSPAVLVINNSQVLLKEIQGTDPSDKKLLHKAFPNLQQNEFYYEIWRKEAISIVSICRKSYIDELIISLSPNFKISTVSLGVCSLSSIADFIGSSTINTNTQTVHLGNVTNIVEPALVKPSILNLNGLEVSNTQLLGFSGILVLLLNPSTSGSIQELNEKLLENFRQDSFFDKCLKAGIGMLLGVLLINFLFFTHYFDKATESEEAISLNKAGIQNMVKIKERIKDKEAVLKGFTSDSLSKSSLLLNSIAKDLPTTILLSEIDYHPLEKRIKQEEGIITHDKLISISGNTISNEEFTFWVENIGRLAEVKNVTIANFGKDQEGNTIFTLKMILK